MDEYPVVEMAIRYILARVALRLFGPWMPRARRWLASVVREVYAGFKAKVAPVRSTYISPTPAHLVVGQHAGPVAYVTTAPQT
jgi:hypothetical protein